MVAKWHFKRTTHPNELPELLWFGHLAIFLAFLNFEEHSIFKSLLGEFLNKTCNILRKFYLESCHFNILIFLTWQPCFLPFCCCSLLPNDPARDNLKDTLNKLNQPHLTMRRKAQPNITLSSDQSRSVVLNPLAVCDSKNMVNCD